MVESSGSQLAALKARLMVVRRAVKKVSVKVAKMAVTLVRMKDGWSAGVKE